MRSGSAVTKLKKSEGPYSEDLLVTSTISYARHGLGEADGVVKCGNFLLELQPVRPGVVRLHGVGNSHAANLNSPHAPSNNSTYRVDVDLVS